MLEPLQSTSWSGIKNKVTELVEVVRGLANIRITRGGPLSEDTVTVSRSGVVIKLRGFPEATGGVPAASATFPLQPVKSAANKLKFRYGTVHGIVPTIGGTELTADLADSPELTITESGKVYVKVDLAADTYEAENPIIAFAATVPADVDRVSAHAEIVDVVYDSGTSAITSFAPAHKGSIDVASCAGVTNYWDLG